MRSKPEQAGRSGVLVRLHTGGARGGRGKRRSAQLAQSPCECAAQIIVGMAVATWKAWACAAEHGFHRRHAGSLAQQLLGDPFVGNAPIGLWKALRNAQAIQPSRIDLSCHRGVTIRTHRMAGARIAKGRHGRKGVGRTRYLAPGSLDQRSTVGGEANLGVQDLHPGSIAVRLPPCGFLVGEAGQPSQMAPIGTGQVSAIGQGQLFADRAGDGWFKRGSADPNPSLEAAGAGLEHETGFMPVGAHTVERRGLAVIQIYQRVAGIAIACIGLDIYVTAVAVANPQKSQRRFAGQLARCPQPFSGEWSVRGVMNEADQIQVVGQRSELTADSLQGEKKCAIEHKGNRRRTRLAMQCIYGVPARARRKEKLSRQQLSNFAIVSTKGAVQTRFYETKPIPRVGAKYETKPILQVEPRTAFISTIGDAVRAICRMPCNRIKRKDIEWGRSGDW